jgi:hypothetical protein
MRQTDSTRRILLCSSDFTKLKPLSDQIERQGFRPLCATHADMARKLLVDAPVCAVILDLLLADSDGVSLGLELRKTCPWLPVLVLTTETNPAAQTANDSPAWVSRVSAQARLIFALKQACRAWEGVPPRILHLEENDESAALLRGTLEDRASLFRARSIPEARIAMAVRDYDIAIVDTAQVLPGAGQQTALAGKPLSIDTSTAGNPLAVLIDSLRVELRVPQPQVLC